MLRLRTAAALIAVAALVAPAHAQEPAVPAREQARVFVEQGVDAQARGDYDAAIALYQKAYDLLPHPALFFNLGQAHRLAGRIEQALAMYRRYLTEVPTGPLADQTRVWIAALETPRAPELRPTVATARVRSTRDEGRGLRLAGIAAVATGLAAAAVGGWYGLEVRRLDDDLSQPGAGYDLERYADGERAERRMIIGASVGGALIVAGAALFTVGWRRRDEPLRVAPMVGGRPGLAVVGRF